MEEYSEISIRRGFRFLRERWKFLFIPPVLAFALCFLYNRYAAGLDENHPYNLLPNEYTAVAYVYTDDEPSIITRILTYTIPGSRQYLRPPKNVRMSTLVQSRYLAQKVSEEKNVPIDRFLQGIRYNNENSSDTVSIIEYTDTDRGRAVDILSTFTGHLQSYYSEISNERENERVRFVERQLEAIDKTIAEIEAGMREFEAKHGIVDIEFAYTIRQERKIFVYEAASIENIEFNRYVPRQESNKISNEYRKLLRRRNLQVKLKNRLQIQYEINLFEKADERIVYSNLEPPGSILVHTGPKRMLINVSVAMLTFLACLGTALIHRDRKRDEA
jgi:hypothetical protein